MLSLMRMIKSAINYKKIELQRELEDSEVIALIRSEIKKRQDSIETYNQGGRADLAEKEQQEVDILRVLPAEMLSIK